MNLNEAIEETGFVVYPQWIEYSGTLDQADFMEFWNCIKSVKNGQRPTRCKNKMSEFMLSVILPVVKSNVEKYNGTISRRGRKAKQPPEATAGAEELPEAELMDISGIFKPEPEALEPDASASQDPEPVEPDEAATEEPEPVEADEAASQEPEPVEADEAASQEPEALEPDASASQDPEALEPDEASSQEPEPVEPDEAATEEPEPVEADEAASQEPEPVEADEAASQEPEALEPDASASQDPEALEPDEALELYEAWPDSFRGRLKTFRNALTEGASVAGVKPSDFAEACKNFATVCKTCSRVQPQTVQRFATRKDLNSFLPGNFDLKEWR